MPFPNRVRPFLPLLLFLLLNLGVPTAMAIEEPAYEVVRSDPAFELRRYAPFIVAETEVEGPFDKAGNRAFGILAGYIFGDNRARTKIEMTAPVSQRPAASERIEMTAPVSQRPGATEGRFLITFAMPARFSLETLPEPTDPRVRLRQEPARLIAARRYSGRWTESRYREQERALLAALGAAGLRPIGEPIYARYNSPFSLWFNRRNEVLVQVAAPDG